MVTIDGRTVTRVTVPKGRKNVSPKTFKSACDMARLSKEKMRELCDCSMSGPEYAELWRKTWKVGKTSPLELEEKDFIEKSPPG